MNRKIVCTHCGDTFDADEMTSFGEEVLCPDCLDELTVVCERCGDRIWAEDAADSDIILCEHCYDNYYTTCEMPYITMSEAVSSVRKGKKLSDSSAWRDTVDEDYKKR